MRYVAAYLLCSLSGSVPTEEDIKRVLESVGIEFDKARASQVVKAMAGKKVDAVIADGMTKMASVPSGGGGAAPAADAASSVAPGGGAAAKEEKKPEPESESDDDMGFGLFD